MFAAHAGKFAVLQNAEQTNLGLQGHFADLVQKQRTAVCLFKSPLPLTPSVGKGAFFVAEQLRFEQSFGYRAAIYLYKRTIFAAGIVVNEIGDQLFARARFAENKDGRARIGDV